MDFVISKQEGEALSKKWKKDARINASRLMFNSTLKNTCLDAIVGHLLQCPKVFGRQRLSSLPDVLKHDIVYKLDLAYCYVDQMELFKLSNYKEILSQLLANISEFSFKYLGHKPPTDEEVENGEFARILRAADKPIFLMLAQKCKNSLRTFVHGEENYDKIMDRYNLRGQPVIRGSLLSLTNLQHLEMDRYVLDNSDFVLLGSKLVNLVHLKCNLLDTTWATMSEGLWPLKQLEVFRFKLHCSKMSHFYTKCPSLDQELYHQCLKEFPQLRVVGSLALEYIVGNSVDGVMCHSMDENTLFGPRSRSQLQHLVLRKTITKSQAEWHQNVTTLRIAWDSAKFEDYETLLNFKNIKTLIFEYQAGEMPTSVVMRFLRVYGQKLKQFRLFAKNVLRVEEIIKFCPNLTHIHLHFEEFDGSVPYFDGFGNPTPKQLRNLTYLYLDWLDASDRPDVLVRIFTAPKLEYILLHGLVVDGFSLTRALHDLQTEAVFAPRLKTLNLSPDADYINVPSNNFPVNLRHHWRLFFRFICSNAPLLKTVERAKEGELNMNDVVGEFHTRMKYIPSSYIKVRKI